MLPDDCQKLRSTRYELRVALVYCLYNHFLLIGRLGPRALTARANTLRLGCFCAQLLCVQCTLYTR